MQNFIIMDENIWKMINQLDPDIADAGYQLYLSQMAQISAAASYKFLEDKGLDPKLLESYFRDLQLLQADDSFSNDEVTEFNKNYKNILQLLETDQASEFIERAVSDFNRTLIQEKSKLLSADEITKIRDYISGLKADLEKGNQNFFKIMLEEINNAESQLKDYDELSFIEKIRQQNLQNNLDEYMHQLKNLVQGEKLQINIHDLREVNQQQSEYQDTKDHPVHEQTPPQNQLIHEDTQQASGQKVVNDRNLQSNQGSQGNKSAGMTQPGQQQQLPQKDQVQQIQAQQQISNEHVGNVAQVQTNDQSTYGTQLGNEAQSVVEDQSSRTQQGLPEQPTHKAEEQHSAIDQEVQQQISSGQAQQKPVQQGQVQQQEQPQTQQVPQQVQAEQPVQHTQQKDQSQQPTSVQVQQQASQYDQPQTPAQPQRPRSANQPVVPIDQYPEG